jgi:hypothetical protein
MVMGLSIGGKLLFVMTVLNSKTKKNTLVVNDEQATIVRTIFNWYIV